MATRFGSNRSLMVSLGVAALVGTASAGVVKVTEAPKLDGRLDDACWRSAQWEGGFRRMSRSRAELNGDVNSRKPTCETTFAMVADERNLYIAVNARHDKMEEMKKLTLNGQWASEALEYHFIPSGGEFEFYQFLLTHYGFQWAMFYSEGGGIKPDPYHPVWEHAIKDDADGWTAEVKIPFSAFYMTRNDGWRETWRMNVGRNYKTAKNGIGEPSAWCENDVNFAELSHFRDFGPFPARRAEDDVCVQALVADVHGIKDGKAAGEIKVPVYLAKGGEFRVETTYSEPVTVTLKDGDNEIKVPAVFPENGRYDTSIAFTRLADGTRLERIYPMRVDYQPVRVKFSVPQYRDNFYPGQDARCIEGTVKTVAAEPVTLVLEGPGFEKQSITMSKPGRFSFDTTGFEYGEAKLTATCGKDTVVKIVRRLKPLPEGEHMSWVENGNLVIDGRPTVMRNLYAEGFAGGTAFDRKYQAEKAAGAMHITTNIFAIKNVDPAWYGREYKYGEMKKDVKPSPKLIELLDKQLDAGRKGGVYYYGFDEPECHGLSAVYLAHFYDYLAAKDPYRVVVSCCRSGDTYIDSGDVFAAHPYLNAYNKPDGTRGYVRTPNRLGRFLDAYHAEEHPEKCIGGAPTCFTYSNGDYPTFTEYVLNYWCEFVRGAKVMLPYAYHDLGDRPQMYEGTRYMFESIEALEDVILYGRRRTLVKTEDCEVCEWTMPEGDRMFVAVNFTQKPQKVAVPGLYGSYREFRGSRTFTSSSSTADFTLSLAPLESLIACEKSRDGGLKTFAEVKAEIEALEYERTHRDNQLYNRFADLVCTTSNGKRGPFWDTPVELFDGTRDVLGWSHNTTAEKYYQFMFKNGFQPKFDTVRVFGMWHENYTVSIPDGKGGWTKLEPVDRQVEGLGVTLKFDRALSPAGLRFGFPGYKVEIYEFELPKVK